MYGRWNVKSLSIYPKLVISFLLVIVPIYVVSLMMNQSGKNIVENQLSEALKAQVHFYLSSFETEISRLVVLKAEYVNDSDFLRLATAADLLNDYEKVQTILSVKNKLYLLKSSTPFVENVKVYFPMIDRSVIANDLSDRIPEEEMKAILDPNNMKSTIFSFQGHLLIKQIYPESVYSGRKPIMALEIELSEKQLKNTLSGIVSSKNKGGALLLGTNQKWSVSGGETDFAALELTKLFREQKPGMPIAGRERVTIEGQSYFIAYELSNVLNSTLVVYVPIEQVLSPLTKYRDWLWLLSIISLLLVIIFSYWIYRLIHKPLLSLVTAFRKVEKGDLSVKVYHRNFDEFHYLYGQFNQMVDRIRYLIQEVYEQQIHSHRSELKQLQSQINPHFLYNSLFMLRGLVRRNADVLSLKMLDNLGEFFKFITRSGSEEVPLEREVGHTVSYLEIQSLRFSYTINITWESLPDEWRLVHVPRLILQPLVENAFRHGLEDKVKGGRLEIRFLPHSDILTILIDDNGDRLSDENLSKLEQALNRSGDVEETTGILNVHRRIQLTYGTEYGLTVARSGLGGLQVRMKIPNRKEELNV